MLDITAEDLANRFVRGTEWAIIDGEHRDIPVLDFYGELEDLIYGDVDPYSSEGIELFKAFARQYNVYLYARVKEDFFPSVGAYDAIDGGYNFIIMENLS